MPLGPHRSCDDRTHGEELFRGDGLPNRSGHRRWNHCIACRCSNPWRPIHRNVGRYGCTRRMVLDGTAGRGLRPPPGMGNRRSIDDAVRLSSIVLCDVEVGGSDPSSRRDLVARNILFARAVACWRSEMTALVPRGDEGRRRGSCDGEESCDEQKKSQPFALFLSGYPPRWMILL